MLHWNRTNRTIAAVAAFAIYFVFAGWTKLTWLEPVPRGRVVFRLERPFEVYGAHGVSCYQLRAQEIFEALADTDDEPKRSPLLLYEGNQPLGPPHSRHRRRRGARTWPLFAFEARTGVLGERQQRHQHQQANLLGRAAELIARAFCFGMISAQMRSASVAREDRFRLFRIIPVSARLISPCRHWAATPSQPARPCRRAWSRCAASRRARS